MRSTKDKKYIDNMGYHINVNVDERKIWESPGERQSMVLSRFRVDAGVDIICDGGLVCLLAEFTFHSKLDSF